MFVRQNDVGVCRVISHGSSQLNRGESRKRDPLKCLNEQSIKFLFFFLATKTMMMNVNVNASKTIQLEQLNANLLSSRRRFFVGYDPEFCERFH